MAYQVLARKWRPQTFTELAGQQHVLQTLSHALDSQRMHHAFLFTGTRGVGKTTIARILAKCLNCEQGISATPCGQCEPCRSISEGRFMDLIEVDAASRTRVEDTRELLDNVQYAPSRGRYKVYLIDEVHMLSTHSFNALLKTLEEPPPHVKFLLATTDPQKLPVTILSRCLQFHLKNLVPADIVSYLQSVLETEQVDHDEAALWQIARAAAGSMRDALTLLDQSISFGDGAVREQAVIDLLGTPDQRLVHDCLRALLARDGAALLQKVADAAAYNPDYERLLEQMLSVLHRVAIAQVVPDAADNSEGDRRQVLDAASQCSAEDLQLYYQIALNAIEEMRHAPDRRMALEMTLLRMLAFSPDVFGASQQKKKRVSPGPDSEQQAPPLAADTAAQNTGAFSAEPDSAGNGESGDRASSEVEAVAAEQSAGEAGSNADGMRAEEPAGVALDALDHDSWATVVDQCGLQGITANVLANCSIERVDGNRVSLVLDQRHSALYADGQRDELESALSRYFNCALELELRIDAPATESPAARRQRCKQEHMERARQAFAEDDNVREVMERFSATIDQDSLEISREDGL